MYIPSSAVVCGEKIAVKECCLVFSDCNYHHGLQGLNIAVEECCLVFSDCSYSHGLQGLNIAVEEIA